MDFVHDYLADGRRIRTFNVVDAFTRECLVIEVDTSLPSARVIGVLDTLLWLFGLPESLRVDNGPEFISGAMEAWAAKHGVKLDFIHPGKPTQIELWRVDYNCERSRTPNKGWGARRTGA